MKVVMLLVVRDDIDVIDTQIAFHLNAGVDFVVATDHDSADGSNEVLASYARQGYLRRLSEHGEARDDEWRTRMAQIAAREYAADWIIDSQVDEFWLPRARGIKDLLGVIPARYGVVQGLRRLFLPRPDDGATFVERLAVRRPVTDIRAEEPAGKLEWVLRPVYRATKEVAAGARDALAGSVPLRGWYPIEVLTFPLRSRIQAERHGRGRSGSTVPRSALEQRIFDAHRADRLPEGWDELVLEDDAMRLGIQDGTYVLDGRLRDALQRIESHAGDGRRYVLPDGEPGRLSLGVPTVVDDVAYAGECAAVREVDVESVAERVQELEDRIASLEGAYLRRATRRLSRLVRR
jgi:hypothetical protein